MSTDHLVSPTTDHLVSPTTDHLVSPTTDDPGSPTVLVTISRPRKPKGIFSKK